MPTASESQGLPASWDFVSIRCVSSNFCLEFRDGVQVHDSTVQGAGDRQRQGLLKVSLCRFLSTQSVVLYGRYSSV